MQLESYARQGNGDEVTSSCPMKNDRLVVPTTNAKDNAVRTVRAVGPTPVAMRTGHLLASQVPKGLGDWAAVCFSGR